MIKISKIIKTKWEEGKGEREREGVYQDERVAS